MSLRDRAEEIIDNYALGHAATAFTVGIFGGQFGADRIALTALTIKMINDICNLYGITDTVAKGVHIASAIGRLTVRGTVIAHYILNWIPFAGPAANSGTTFYLTRKAGRECINDIEKDRMNFDGQVYAAAVRTGTILISHNISEVANEVATDIVDTGVEAIENTCSAVINSSDQIPITDSSELVDELRKLLTSSSVIDAEKEFISNPIDQMTNRGLSGEKINFSSVLKSSLFQAVLIGGLDLGDEFLNKHKMDLVQRLQIYKQFLPENICTQLEVQINDYKHSTGADREEAIHNIIQTIQVGSTIHAEALSFFKTLCSHFDCTQFKDGIVPFSDGGINGMKEKLAFIAYESNFSHNSDNNWQVSERILWSKDILSAVIQHVKNVSIGENDNNIALERAIQSTLNDWGLVPDSDNFVSNCASAIINNNELLSAFAVRFPLITQYVESCSLAAYGMHFHVAVSEKSHWLFVETFAKILSQLMEEKHKKQSDVLSDIHLITHVLRVSVEIHSVPPLLVPSYDKLLSEILFLKGTFNMARLLRADLGCCNTIVQLKNTEQKNVDTLVFSNQSHFFIAGKCFNCGVSKVAADGFRWQKCKNIKSHNFVNGKCTRCYVSLIAAQHFGWRICKKK